MDQTPKKVFPNRIVQIYCAIIKKYVQKESVSPYYFKEFSCLKVFLKDLFCFFK